MSGMSDSVMPQNGVQMFVCANHEVCFKKGKNLPWGRSAVTSDNISRSVMLSIRPAGTPPPERGECGADRAEWQERIEHILREGSPFLSDKLDDALDTLQEHTLADIHALMESLEISSARRLVFTLDREGRLDAGEHPRREALRALLRVHPEITGNIRTMAALALAEKGMAELRLADKLLRKALQDDDTDKPRDDGEIQPMPLFQACLQGALSHFHLLKKDCF